LAKLTDTQKSMVILGAGVALAVGAGVLIYLDIKKTDETKAEIEVQRGVKLRNDAEIAKIPGAEKDLVAYQKIVADNSKILPTEDDIYSFIKDLSKMEAEIGFGIRTLPQYTSTTMKAVASISQIPMKMQLTATTRAFLRFLNQLENRERLVNVTSIQFTPSNEETKPGIEAEHDVNIAFDLYRYDPKAGPPVPFPIKTKDRVDALLENPDVKKTIAEKGRPASIEKYQLLAGRDGRRDLFADPRRRIEKGPEGPRGEGTAEEAILEGLLVQVKRFELELESFRNAEKAKDFLRMAALRRNLTTARDQLVESVRNLSANSPEFKRRDLLERYRLEVRGPYEDLLRQAAEIVGGGGTDVKVTTEMAAGMRKDLEDHMAARKFQEADERWKGMEALLREAKPEFIEEGAKPHIAEMKRIGEHAKYQALLYQKKIEVQGIVRMERGSAAIVNGRTLFPNKSLDKETIFLRAEQGRTGEGDRLVFSLQGHEVDFLQPRPQLLTAERATLQQD
jgi:hypothetical protein